VAPTFPRESIAQFKVNDVVVGLGANGRPLPGIFPVGCQISENATMFWPDEKGTYPGFMVSTMPWILM